LFGVSTCLAQAYGFQFLPPFLDKHADFSNGANFAVAGATAMDASFFEERHIEPIFTNFSLDTQIEWFKTFKQNYCYGTPGKYSDMIDPHVWYEKFRYQVYVNRLARY